MSRRAILQSLARQLPSGEFFLDADSLKAHSGDQWFASALPEAVALPACTASVSKILAFAHRHRIPVTPRGAGHGYVGGCVPSNGGKIGRAHV